MAQMPPESLAYQRVIVVARNIESSRLTCEALRDLGIEQIMLVTKYDIPMELIKRADAEGGVPIVLIWQEPHHEFVEVARSLLDSNTLPGRPIFLVAPDEEAESLLVQDMGEVIREYHSAEILLQTALMNEGWARELMRSHLFKAPACYLGPKRQDRNATPAPATIPPNEERRVNNIERRVMQRGMFKIQLLRTPRFR